MRAARLFCCALSLLDERLTSSKKTALILFLSLSFTFPIVTCALGLYMPRYSESIRLDFSSALPLTTSGSPGLRVCVDPLRMELTSKLHGMKKEKPIAPLCVNGRCIPFGWDELAETGCRALKTDNNRSRECYASI